MGLSGQGTGTCPGSSARPEPYTLRVPLAYNHGAAAAAASCGVKLAEVPVLPDAAVGQSSLIDQAFDQNVLLGDPSQMSQPPALNLSAAVPPSMSQPYAYGVKDAQAQFAPVPPPSAPRPSVAGKPAVQAAPQTTSAAPKPPVPLGADLPPTATAAQVAVAGLRQQTQSLATHNPAYKIAQRVSLAEFLLGDTPVRARPGEIQPDNGRIFEGTNFEPPQSNRQVSNAFNGLEVQRNLDLLNAGNEAYIGATA